MKTRTIGNRTVSAIGLGGMPMSIEGRPDRDRSIATIHAALDAGVTLIDTADAYHLHADEVGHNESLIAEALQSWGGDTSDVLVATKGGHLRPGDGSWTLDGSPGAPARGLRGVAQAARRRGDRALPVPPAGPGVPYEESVGAIGELLDEGKIRMAGISNADPDQIRLAQEILGGRLVCVQNQFSPAFRSSEPELRLCDEMGIAFLPWSPLGGISKAGELGSTFAPFEEVADAHGVSPQQVTLAWMLATSPVVDPDPGLVAPRDGPRLRRRRRPGADRGRAAAALHHRLSRFRTTPYVVLSAGGRAGRRTGRSGGGTTGSRRAAGFRRMAGQFRTPTPKRTSPCFALTRPAPCVPTPPDRPSR